LRILALAALALLEACSGGRPAEMKSDWEKDNERLLTEAPPPEEAPPLPPYPKNEDLLAFGAGPASEFKYYVDRNSISVKDGQVRYTMLARSASGADNIAYEAINCKAREFRSFARGTGDGKWIARPTPWRRIEARVHAAQYALHWEYLCPDNLAVRSAAEGVSALRAGGHPNSKLPSGFSR
jgi:hypothetical protein